MIRININVMDLGADAAVDAVKQAFDDRQGLNAAMASGVENSIVDHLLGLSSRSPNTDYFASAARGVETEADERHAVVRIPKLGFALHYYGGTVFPGKGISSFTGKPTRALAIPSDKVPVIGPPDGLHRMRPGEYPGLLAFLPTKSDKSIGVLVEGEEKEITRGKRKGGKRIVPKSGGNLLYVLASSATHLEDPSVLPTITAMQAAAKEGAQEHINSYTDQSS